MSKDTKSRLPLSSNEKYKENVKEQLRKRSCSEDLGNWLKTNAQALLSVFLLNLEPIHSLLSRLYSPKDVGNTPIDPQIVLRCYLLMFAFGETSTTNWAKRIACEERLAIFCGTTAKQAPAVGTYYNFKKRLENGWHNPKCPHRVLPSEQRQARVSLRQANGKPEEKSNNNDPEVVHGQVIRNYVNEVKEKEDQPVTQDLETILNEILALLAVKPSAEEGYINDLSQLELAGDGSTVRSASSTTGKPTCDCREQGIYKCDHPRIFSDYDAQWGWDNRQKDFIFGYRYFQLVTNEGNHDFPIYINIASANTHEAKMLIAALDRAGKTHHFQTEALSLDALYDIQALYEFLTERGIKYAIAYAQEPAKCLSLGKDQQLFNSQGVPLCPGGLAMKRAAKDKQDRDVYHCPVKRVARRDGKRVRVVHHQECPLATLCEPESQMGPLVHVAKDLDPRVFPSIPRESEHFKQLARFRSCAERSNSMKKCNYKIKYTHMFVMSYAFIRLAFISILEHSRVWAQKAIDSFDSQNQDIFALFS